MSHCAQFGTAHILLDAPLGLGKALVTTICRGTRNHKPVGAILGVVCP